MSRSIRSASTAVLSAVLLACLPASAALAAPSPGQPPVVHTGSGAVSGVQADGVDGYLGIPYAAPPVGELRWSPPQPPAPWDGVRAADAYGNRCPATESTNGPRSETED
jgi:hypothetical protein